MHHRYLAIALVGLATLPHDAAHAAGVAGVLEEVIVTGTNIGDSLHGRTESASVGTVLPQQIKLRPLLRPAEILETVPGMVVTQHSGEGKANQYFLRGFNLDHGTDFANVVEAAPINQVTHGHGQGYTDVNFLIPELVERVVYRKGPYYASEGDFSSAGAAHTRYRQQLEQHEAKLTVGEDNYRRSLFTGSTDLATRHLLYGLEVIRNDGPWVSEQHYDKHNAVLKYGDTDGDRGFSLTALYYQAEWDSTDQIPQRLVNNGNLDRFGTLDDTTGGDTHRYQLSLRHWSATGDAGSLEVSAYAVDYKLRLTSNPSFFSRDSSEDPDFRGDQFTQFDDRVTAGGALTINREINSRQQLESGLSTRFDDIREVGVGASQSRDIYSLLSHAAVEELSAAAYLSLRSQWSDWFGSTVGLRYDHFEVDVSDKLTGSQRGANDERVSPKLALRFGPFRDTEVFLNYGRGFHSNDARGATSDSDAVPLLSPSTGYEIGLRSAAIADVQLSMALFHLELDSELVFVGDDGTTEPRGASDRDGIELGIFYQPTDWLVVDLDYARSRSRFKREQFDGSEPLGDHIPDSIRDVFSLGAVADFNNGLFAALRLRYFGPRDLDESGELRSESTSSVNANLGYRFRNGLTLRLDALNLLDSEDDDITYYYASRTGEERLAATPPVDDFHSHPMIPRTLRATIAFQF